LCRRRIAPLKPKAGLSGPPAQGIKAGSKEAAEQAAKEWVGEGAQPIVERSTGQQVGWKSADGTKIARFTSVNKPQPYINLENKMTGGNLHVQY
jgi:hypothetical protein